MIDLFGQLTFWAGHPGMTGSVSGSLVFFFLFLRTQPGVSNLFGMNCTKIVILLHNFLPGTWTKTQKEVKVILHFYLQ